MTDPHGILVIGVGNEFRGDDVAGLHVARRIRKRGIKGVTVVESDGEGGSLVDLWQGHGYVMVVDAVAPGLLPGRIVELDALKSPIASQFFRYSSHAFSVAEAIEVARRLGKLPPALIIYGIEGLRFEAGRPPTVPVCRSVAVLTDRILSRISMMMRQPLPISSSQK